MFFRIVWKHLWHSKASLWASFLGLMGAFVLISLQLGFLKAGKDNVTGLYRLFDFDLALISKNYLSFQRSGEIDAYRAIVLEHDQKIERFMRLNADGIDLKQGQQKGSCLLLGLDPQSNPFLDEQMNHQLAALEGSRKLLIDSASINFLGKLKQGDLLNYLHHEIEVGGHFNLGLGLIAPAFAITTDRNYAQLLQRDQRHFHVGLIRLHESDSPQHAKALLSAQLPEDVEILTRAELLERETTYFLEVKPIGIIFRFGAFVAFSAGLVMLHQMISRQLSLNLSDFALLKALGHSPQNIYGIGFCESLLAMTAGFSSSVFICAFIFSQIQALTSFPTAWNTQLLVEVYGLGLMMVFFTTCSSLKRVHQLDPAQLFR